MFPYACGDGVGDLNRGGEPAAEAYGHPGHVTAVVVQTGEPVVGEPLQRLLGGVRGFRQRGGEPPQPFLQPGGQERVLGECGAQTRARRQFVGPVEHGRDPAASHFVAGAFRFGLGDPAGEGALYGGGEGPQLVGAGGDTGEQTTDRQLRRRRRLAGR